MNKILCGLCLNEIPAGSGAVIRTDAGGHKHYYHHKCRLKEDE